jgi:predicted ribosomally synthesized peptide with nif11-like leader
MSLQDADRFAKDLKAKPQLLQELKKTAAGMGLAGVCRFAKEKGYNVTVDEAKNYIRSKAKGELNDQQLDRIAGGKGVPDTNVTQTINVTSAVSVAVAAADVAEAAGAVTVAVVAGAIVIT